MFQRIRIVVTLFSCLLTGVSLAQTERKLSSTCACSTVLEETIDKVSRIYAGFDDKVNAQTKPQYDRLLQLVRQQAKQTDAQAACLATLRTYTSFFKDSHVAIIWNKSGAKAVLYSEAVKDRSDLVEFKQLNSDYIYLKLALFNQREVDKLDSLLRANKDLVAKTPNLIFDLRGNGGGTGSTSEEMINLIYTNPIIYPAWDYRSSPERIENLLKELEGYKKDTVANAFFYQRAKRLLDDMKAKPGAMVREGEALTRTANVDLAANPKRVAFLIDKGCASSTEFLVFEGKQSKKVTLFGTNTLGVMDYGSDQKFDLCDGTFNLAVPWGRNGWVRQYRIDNIGFAPDVRIPASETDWVGFVQRYYQKMKAGKK
ncbi:S41 family peptidase [Spirosoma pollinicola]|uniref:Tail specific protease domain-containing protein n=1 Tax=Spirosoma pollinicola TaxID=2057025 RepID=A0A2K8Z0I2_9BACT|nr:S41 family peptidase [Spirosoma pollinicola]AUD03392.1 hypothetical protein CWM47_17065 [Spirosoma pollinicola]